MRFWNVGEIEPGVSAKPYLILLMSLALRTARVPFHCIGLTLLDRSGKLVLMRRKMRQIRHCILGNRQDISSVLTKNQRSGRTVG